MAHLEALNPAAVAEVVVAVVVAAVEMAGKEGAAFRAFHPAAVGGLATEDASVEDDEAAVAPDMSTERGACDTPDAARTAVADAWGASAAHNEDAHGAGEAVPTRRTPVDEDEEAASDFPVLR